MHPRAVYEEVVTGIAFGPASFLFVHHAVSALGWLAVMPWRKAELHLNTELLLEAAKGDAATLEMCTVTELMTQPPKHLTESELINQMDSLGIGTDASIPTHVETIGTRFYIHVRDSEGRIIVDADDSRHGGGPPRSRPSPQAPTGSCGPRYMVPSRLGIAMIACFETADPVLANPSLRAKMEKQITLVADGNAPAQTVLDANLALFYKHYCGFVKALPQIRPLLISEHAAEAVGNSWAEVPMADNLGRLSDRQLQKREAAADVVSTVASDRERLRREQDRRQASVRPPSGASASAALAAELFNWYGEGDEGGVLHDSEGQPTAVSAVSAVRHASASGRKHYQLELERLVNLDQSEEAKNLEALLHANPAGRDRVSSRHGGGRGGRGGSRRGRDGGRDAVRQGQRGGGGGGGKAPSAGRSGGRGHGHSGNRDARAKVTITRMYDSD